ncbi:MAG TPA: DUF433 domain-containing protein [Candidatus Nanoarchaeia archaeon]|nr:DUF433 domain-containing protein [Candidatus Nanoarchaeia archaeon]
MEQKWQGRIEINPRVLVGKPIIKGTRISVDFILDLLAHGWTNEQIIKNYPQLKKTDIQAALEYSAHSLRHEAVYPLEA